MADKQEEITDALLERGETKVSDSSEDVKESSSETADVEKEGEETPETEEKTEETEEESFKDAVDRVAKSQAQSIADISNQTITKDRDGWQDRAEKAESELSDKTWDFAINGMFDEETANLGEEKAAKLKETRLEAKKQFLESQKNAAYITKTMALLGNADLVELIKTVSKFADVKNLEDIVNHFNGLGRYNRVINKLRPLYFPDEKKTNDEYNKAIKRFENTYTDEDIEIVFEGIRQELKGKTPKFVPDSGKQDGGGNVKDESPEARVARGLAKKRKLQGS